MPKAPVRVAVTGAAGQIGYSLPLSASRARDARKDQPVILQMLEIPDEKAQKALKGVMMGARRLRLAAARRHVPASDPMVAFQGRAVALLVGARPRGPGMERKDLLEGERARSSRRRARRSAGSLTEREVWSSATRRTPTASSAMKNAPA